jgi:hypothetical protein
MTGSQKHRADGETRRKNNRDGKDKNQCFPKAKEFAFGERTPRNRSKGESKIK